MARRKKKEEKSKEYAFPRPTTQGAALLLSPKGIPEQPVSLRNELREKLSS